MLWSQKDIKLSFPKPHKGASTRGISSMKVVYLESLIIWLSATESSDCAWTQQTDFGPRGPTLVRMMLHQLASFQPTKREDGTTILPRLVSQVVISPILILASHNDYHLVNRSCLPLLVRPKWLLTTTPAAVDSEDESFPKGHAGAVQSLTWHWHWASLHGNPVHCVSTRESLSLALQSLLLPPVFSSDNSVDMLLSQ